MRRGRRTCVLACVRDSTEQTSTLDGPLSQSLMFYHVLQCGQHEAIRTLVLADSSNIFHTMS